MKYIFSIIVFTFFSIFSSLGASYSINFTVSGAASTFDSVLVTNFNKGTSVVVHNGNVLNLTDVTALNDIQSQSKNLHLYTNNAGVAKLTFNASFAGQTLISVFGFDGKMIAQNASNLPAGVNAFEISLPQGDYIIQVNGNGYSYSAKTSNTSHSKNQISIKNSISQIPHTFQKVKSDLPTTSMNFSVGDTLLYKAISGNYSTIIVDMPTQSKSTNFNFDACTDADGNNYCTVILGNQTWMSENLKTTKYNDGSNIPYLISDAAWVADSLGAYCWYNNDIAHKPIYGALYNWFTVKTSKIAPIGWHVPTEDEYQEMKKFINKGYFTYVSTDSIGGKIKERGISQWLSSNKGATNETGFSAIPAGSRLVDGSNVAYYKLNEISAWWTSSNDDGTINAWFEYVSYKHTGFYPVNPPKTCGVSVRCIKD